MEEEKQRLKIADDKAQALFADEGATKKGKKTENFTDKKGRNVKLATFMSNNPNVSDKTPNRVWQCSTYLAFVANKDFTQKALREANFCMNRFCPVCSWRKARRDTADVATIMNAIQSEQGYQYLFLTLTTPNVKAAELGSEIKFFNRAFLKMSQTKPFKALSFGYMRKLEVTYNPKRDDYNPHFHVVIAVQKSYFHNTKIYLNHDKWLQMWQKATGRDDIKIVNVQKVGSRRGNQDLQKAVKEIAKYSAKDTDYTRSQDNFDAFYSALKGKQLLTFNGVFKEYRTKLNAGELDQYRPTANSDQAQVFYCYLLQANWKNLKNGYKLMYRPLTDDEIKAVNNKNKTDPKKEKDYIQRLKNQNALGKLEKRLKKYDKNK